MLILVGVTINLSANGKLFDKARTASTDTEEQKILEELIQNANFNNEGEIDVEELIEKVKSKYDNVEYADTGKLTITGNKGTYEYKVTKTEIELWKELTDLEKYLTGADGKGRELIAQYDDDENLIDGILDVEDWLFKQDLTNINSNIYKEVKLAYVDLLSEAEDGTYWTYRIRYGREVYDFETVETETGETILEGSLKKVYTPEGNLGKYVTYKGKDWIVLYDNEEKVELISAETLGELKLGEDYNLEVRKEVYNNVIKTLTEACKKETGITEGIRNVGGPEKDPDNLQTIKLNDLIDTGFNLQESKKTEIENLINNLKQGDENYLTDYNQMKKLGILATDTPKNYWLASRLLNIDDESFGCRVRLIEGDGYLDDTDSLFYFSKDHFGAGEASTCSLRPVVRLNSGSLNGKSGEGTRTSPINLDE